MIYVAVREVAAHRTPFGTLLHFEKDIRISQPRVLIVAPMSGHFATLLRETVRTMLADHDVYITDWHNARDVPLTAGRFGLDEYTEHLMMFLDVIGPGAHLVAICQPCVSALAAVALMSEDNHAATPASLTLMAGPIDCRISPTEVDKLATSKSIAWFERNLIDAVPSRDSETIMRKGKTALITGSTSGIGQDIAEAFAAQGANIVLNGFGPSGEIETLRARIAAQHGVAARYDGADMTKPETLEAMLAKAIAEFGAVDILVNNAGIQHVAPIEEFPVDKWNAIIAINLLSAFHTMRLAVPAMKRRKWGRLSTWPRLTRWWLHRSSRLTLRPNTALPDSPKRWRLKPRPSV